MLLVLFNGYMRKWANKAIKLMQYNLWFTSTYVEVCARLVAYASMIESTLGRMHFSHI